MYSKDGIIHSAEKKQLPPSGAQLKGATPAKTGQRS